jgi:hypothetical protein
MRLLHFDALGKLILTDFRGKPIPPYAILSHRWSDSEILIEDVLNGSYKQKEDGYRKLRFCAEQADRDGLQYFWIDTSCINKWDNNERSKAINSMFRWYQNAARCYVFLSDVSLSVVKETGIVPCSDWEASFRASAWFTRGWTLQELIAPVTVEFFSREGHRLGDRTSLEILLHDITDIALAALRNCPLDHFSTSERQQWAKNRTTTEEEDIVYCLLGVLGVSMPTTYGEGKESALRRLQAEIEGAGSAPSIIPFSRNESFVGREAQLAELEAKLFSIEQTTTTLAIVGPGGTGKSQLALEVAHRTRLNNKNCAVFWIDASDIDSLYRSHAGVAQKLSVPGCDDDQTDPKQVVKHCVAAISARQCLLIYDNVEGTTLRVNGSSAREATELTDFLPRSKLCSVIFTTTESDTAEALASQNVIVLRELTPDTALRMLQNRLTTPLSNAEQQEAMHLLEGLLYLPLALVQAAACMNASNMTVLEYRAQLAEHKEAALEYSDDPSEGELREIGLRKAVAATLSLSISQVRQNNAVAADYLFLAACVDRKDISLQLLKAASPQAREDAIKVLDSYALVIRRPADSALDIHRLVHSALRKRLQAEGRLQEWVQHTTTQLLWLFPNDNHSNRSKWRRLLPHAQYVLSHTQKDDDEERLDLAQKCAMALHSDGQYKGAEELEVQVMQTRKTVLGEEHPSTLISMANLASTYRNQGRWKEAKELELHVLQTRKKVLGDEHPDTLTSMVNLASTYRDQGQWDDAEKLLIYVVEIREKKLMEGDPQTLKSIFNLASVYWNQGRWDKAEGLELRVMENSKEQLGASHPDTLTAMNNLASTYCSQGRWKAAEKLFAQVVKVRTDQLGADHPDTLTSMVNLATTNRNQGRWADAEKLELEMLKARKGKLGADHPDTLMSMANLALTYLNQSRWDAAEKLGSEVLKARKEKLGEAHPDTLISMANLASTYWSQGRWDEAEVLEVKVFKARKNKLGADHPDTLTSMVNLAAVYWKQGKQTDAEKLEVAALEARKKKLGVYHPDTLMSMANLTMTYNDQGQWDAAEKLGSEVLEARKERLGAVHPDTLMSMAHLACVWKKQSQRKKAISQMKECVQLGRQSLGDDSPAFGSFARALAQWEAEEADGDLTCGIEKSG